MKSKQGYIKQKPEFGTGKWLKYYFEKFTCKDKSIEEPEYCDCPPRVVTRNVKIKHPTVNNSILIGRPIMCEYCGKLDNRNQ